MGRKKAAEVKVAAEPVASKPAAKPASKKGEFVVLDSNGKKFRVVDTAEKAQELAAHIGGRVK